MMLATHVVCPFAADAAFVGDCSLHLLLLLLLTEISGLVAAANAYGTIHSSAQLHHALHVHMHLH